jgi:hypothetical protein
MSKFVQFLDAVTAYQYARKNEHMMRVAPPEKSVQQLADEAEAIFDQLVAVKIAELAPKAASADLSGRLRGL